MHTVARTLLLFSAFTIIGWPVWAVDYYVAVSGGHVPPFANWSNAATNIQDAIDAASAGDTVWVTNGVYATGGKVMAGDLTNRVALDKALTVRSVNGPGVTIIEGAWHPGTTNGAAAVRGAWLTNSASLVGFTVRRSATRNTGDTVTVQSGGGIWCIGATATVSNCVVVNNRAASLGGGVYQGTFVGCVVEGNWAGAGGGAAYGNLLNCSVRNNSAATGGGVYSVVNNGATVVNCSITGNNASMTGGGVYSGSAASVLLTNCTVTLNRAGNAAGGTYGGTFRNCIVYLNTSPNAPNHSSGSYSFSCTTPLPIGTANISLDPLLIGDGIHLSASSPCIGAGNPADASGTDVDGQSWSNAPAMGCDEWHPQPVAGYLQVNPIHSVGKVSITVPAAGQAPFGYRWFKDAQPVTNAAAYSGFDGPTIAAQLSDDSVAGNYSVVVSNAFGTVTSAVVKLKFHYVNAAGMTPAAPYTNWSAAATDIQFAIDAAEAGAIVVVTNGVYSTGGKVMAGDLTNRVALDKPLSLLSVNGAAHTAIRGLGPNGTNAVRGVWMGNGALLFGFTIERGATRTSGDSTLIGGGGVWCATNAARIVSCRLLDNTAHLYGGGAFFGSFSNCVFERNVVGASGSGGGTFNANLDACRLFGNQAGNGGGAFGGALNGCALVGNSASVGGGAASSKLVNCTVTRNTASSNVGGVAAGGVVSNSIVYFNTAPSFPNNNGPLFYSCAYPMPSGTGNISADPQFLADGIHIAPTSPCVGAGLASAATGTDLDGQPWNNPPSMGCDEYHPAPVIASGPSVTAADSGALSIQVGLVGESPFTCFWFRDGVLVTNSASYSGAGTEGLTLNLADSSVAGNYQVIVSNSYGVATSTVTPVVLHFVNLASSSPQPPYASWDAAANSIQDAIDAAADRSFVVVSNGVYASGGRVMAGDLTNRVVVDKTITLTTLAGPEQTIIQGAWDPVTTNGPLAIRCVWLGNGAILNGFTLQGGATRLEGDVVTLQYGGGAWCEATNATIANCIIQSNSAHSGGGCYRGTITRSLVTANSASNGGGGYESVFFASRLKGNNATGWGGGARLGNLENCVIERNVASQGGGAHLANVNRCIVVENMAWSSGGGLVAPTLTGTRVSNSRIAWNTAGSIGGGIAGSPGSTYYNCTITANTAPTGGGTAGGFAANSIVYGNGGGGNFSGTSFQYSCTTPFTSGTGNIFVDPQLLGDLWHIATTSPCRGAGSSTYATGTDLDGSPWANPPSMGCDEWTAAPAVAAPVSALDLNSGRPVIKVSPGGQAPFTFWWFKDGVLVTNDAHFVSVGGAELVVDGFGPSDAGSYHVVVSNAFGVVTSAVAQVQVHCVDAAGTNPVAPYTAWASAATNIQDAVDVASSGAIVLVTNGVYASGGRAIGGGVSNRVAVTRPLTVASVNGPTETIIQGAWHPGTTNGVTAMRCVWLTSGASIGGFNLAGGATLAITGTPNHEMNGGGVWALSTNAVVVNCVISANVAANQGGGAYGVALYKCTLVGNRAVGSGVPGSGYAYAGSGGGAAYSLLSNCTLSANEAKQGSGGGAYYCVMANCALTWNSAGTSGGAVDNGIHINCTMSGNHTTGSTGSSASGGASNAKLTNCIVYGNWVGSFLSLGSSNYYNSTLAFSCTAPLPAGDGNISADPQLLSDGVHLAMTSPCRGAGTNVVVGGTDIDGQAWLNPPAIGCDEWRQEPVPLAGPTFRLGVARELVATMAIAGHEPFTCFWSKDGTPLEEGVHYTDADSPSLRIKAFDLVDSGTYQVVVSNSFGVATSQVAQLVIHGVNASNSAPVPPYRDWSTAATNIQDAINVAGVGAFILVTNGVYAHGGKVMTGDLVNRVALDKPVVVVSMHGPTVTTIQGAWDPATTNGPLAVRCAWVTYGAELSGFTLTKGATRSGGLPDLMRGGGVWCDSTRDAVVSNCRIISNVAHSGGGGSRWGALRNCALIDNRVVLASGTGGGALGGTFVNCTIVGNYAPYAGGGQQDASLTNCIVYHNRTDGPFHLINNAGGPLVYSCSPSLTPGVAGNINDDPQLVDGYHLAVTSPCRGAGTNLAAGVDLDGEPWMAAPSIGCDEVWESNIVGPLSVEIVPLWPRTPIIAERGSLNLYGALAGHAARVAWDYGDGSVLTNPSLLNVTHAWTNAGNYSVTFTAFNADHPAGVSTNLDVQVIPLVAPVVSNIGLSDTSFTLSFPGQPGVTYAIERATNLVPPVTWQTIRSIMSTGQVMQVTDTAATNEMLFYRVRGP